MIDRTHALSLTKQAVALGISRGTLYYEPRPVAARDLVLMRRMDRVHTEMPWTGARGMRRLLRAEFPGVGRRHLGTLMRRMGLAAIAPQPGTSRRHRAHAVFPYLLRNRLITRPNEVWSMDITYIPMPRGFVYLAAVMDWASRRILSWRVSITLDSAFCVDALEDAIAHYGAPAIVNTDQGSQFTSGDFTRAVLDRQIQLSMDGKGCWRDNIFVERFWRSLKYEEVYLHAYETVSMAKDHIGRYITLYNSRRPHSSLNDLTPDQMYFFPAALAQAA